jgi:molybdate transport system regulatory protein
MDNAGCNLPEIMTIINRKPLSSGVIDSSAKELRQSPEAKMNFRVRSKIWIENDQGKLVIGTGRLKILEAIMELGSMNKAAQKLKQPFRAVWGKIRATEERCGFKLVSATKEGTRLTEEGLELLWAYLRLRNRCEKFTDTQFQELFGDLRKAPESMFPDTDGSKCGYTTHDLNEK